MKAKSHSGAKKRVKVRSSGTISVRKSCKNHLLSDKSKRAKNASPFGMAVDQTKLVALRRLLPGQVK